MTIRSLFRAYFPLVLLAALYEACLQLFAERPVSPLDFDLIAYLPNLLPVTIMFILGGFGILIFRAALRNSGTATRRERLVRWWRRVPWFELLVGRILLGFLFLELIQSSFAAFKPFIPALNPFSWDPIFAAMDRALMLGTDPWAITHALLPTPTATLWVDILYVIWYVALISSYFYIMVQPLGDQRRLAVMVSLGLCWFLFGGLAATVFSSAGPIYYEQVYGDATFVPLVERLKAQSEIAAPIHGFAVLNASDLVWRGYIGEPGVPSLGIAAFPSMHVCMVALIWVYARAQSRIWGWIAFVYMIAIVIGSVHLGWHYLVDGLFSIIGAWVVWVVSLRFAEYWFRRWPDVAV